MNDHSHSTIGSNPPRILLVDDDFAFLRDMRELLMTFVDGLRIDTAASGPEGLHFLGASGVDLIISDQNMPGMDGLHFLDAAHQLAPAAHRILLTADHTLNESSPAVQAGGLCGFIAKPPNPRRTVEAVRRLLHGECHVGRRAAARLVA